MKSTVITIALLGLIIGPSILFAQDLKRDSSKPADSPMSLAREGPQDKQAKKAPPDDFVGYEKEPVVVKRVEPKYPELALKAALQGNVLLRVWVDESGDVVETRIVRSDDKIFEDAAAKAAGAWKFTPAMIKGKPVAVWVTIPFRFTIPSPGKGKSKEYDVFIESLQSIAISIIQGRKPDQTKLSVLPEAYVIDGNHYENLYAVLNGEIKTCKVVEGPSSKIPFFNAYITDDMTAASVVLKSVSADGKRERYHTVLIVRQPGGDWKIRSWHVSG